MSLINMIQVSRRWKCPDKQNPHRTQSQSVADDVGGNKTRFMFLQLTWQGSGLGFQITLGKVWNQKAPETLNQKLAQS